MSSAPKEIPTQEDLRFGYVALESQHINFPELHACLNAQVNEANKNKRYLKVGTILMREGYLSKADHDFCSMVLQVAENSYDKYPLLKEDKITLKQIYKEYQEVFKNLKEGSSIGPYTIDGVLGRGGMGIVLLVAVEDDDEYHALKILGGGPKANVRAIQMFKKEATIMSQIRHNNIVKIFGVGRERGLDYIDMEYIEGESLKQMVKREDFLPARAALKLMRGIAEAVKSIHRLGIIHRDLKPDNIMLEVTGRPVLMDFGLASFDKVDIKAVGGSVGTPLYQPPEQAEVAGRFGEISPASDVWGLGATLYYLVTGQPPFTGSTKKEIRKKVKTEPVDPPRLLNPKIPKPIEEIIMTCLEKDQKNRYKNPEKLIKAIDSYTRKRRSGAHKSQRKRSSGIFRRFRGK